MDIITKPNQVIETTKEDAESWSYWRDKLDVTWNPTGRMNKKDNRHKHADLIHAWAEGAEVEFCLGSMWVHKDDDCWEPVTLCEDFGNDNCYKKFRIKPNQVIEITKEDAESWSYWRDKLDVTWKPRGITTPKPKEKKKVKMWQWIIKDMWGNLSTTNMFYKDNSIREIAIDSGQEGTSRSERTMIGVERWMEKGNQISFTKVKILTLKRERWMRYSVT